MQLAPGARHAPHVMTTAIYLIISGALIGAGIAIIWRDVRARRQTFVSERDARLAAEMTAGASDVEITIARGPEPPPVRSVAAAKSFEPPAARAAPAVRPSAAATPIASPAPTNLDAVRERLSVASRSLASGVVGSYGEPARPAVAPQPDDDQPRQGARLAQERQWSALQPAIASGVERTNAGLVPVGILIGPVGEPSWSYKDKSYGAYRRVLLSGGSLAWLRLELLADGRLRVGVRAHSDDRASINATMERQAAGLSSDDAFALFSQCLQPTATLAAAQMRDSDERASEAAWQSVDALVVAALRATNSALGQAGAQLTALAPAAWESGLRRHRMALAVEVSGNEVARMHIERLPHEMEVAVGLREPQLADLGRRRRIPIDGMTIHALAELIASCAWPAIARFQDARRHA